MIVPDRVRLRWSLLIAGAAVSLYSLGIILFVALVPDIRLRWLLVDSSMEPGIRIERIDGARTKGPLPEVGDRILQIGQSPVTTSVDAAWRIVRLWPAWGHSRVSLETPGSVSYLPLRYWSQSEQRELTTEIEIQSVPSFEIGITLLWFLCQSCIFAVGALAFWKRPFDRPVRLFFAMCIVTLGAFVGGYHWWLLSGSVVLSLPFVFCALLVPSVTLHFFLAYPQSKLIFDRHRAAFLWGLYFPPVFAMAAFVILEALVWAAPVATTASGIPGPIHWLHVLRAVTYGYLVLAASYFLGTLICLLHSVWTTQPVLERRQVTFILSAALIASLFIGYTLILACWDRVEFALGGARVPMFLASVVFMAAYAVGIVRFKLMLTEDDASRGLVLEGTRLFGASLIGLAMIAIAMMAGRHTTGLPSLPMSALGLVLLIVAVVLIGSRDVLQRQLERRLFRERFRLEKALQRINRAVGQLADPHYLSERTLLACCEVLQAEWSAMYLCDGDGKDTFRLSGMKGAIVDLPIIIPLRADFLRAIELEGGVVSTYGARRVDSAVISQYLTQLHADLVHLLEIDGEVAGLIALGPKTAGGMYSGEDGTFLTALTQLTGVALHCVRVHQDLTQLNDQLKLKVERIAQQRQQILMLQSELASTRAPVAALPDGIFRREMIKGSGPAISAVLNVARKAASSEATVLIRGESGTGKELLARAIHDNSPRCQGPLITVHCAALAPTLLESELFGHVKGAFTGATGERRGRFELADGGTLFLDEVGEISPEVQVKLLRVLQQRVIEPVGSATSIPVNVRVVAATHRDLEAMIADGTFREDLYYRLNVITLAIPPLRERREDLQELANEFLRRAAEKCGKQVIDFEEPALMALLEYGWPGNIRELENVIERAVVLADGEMLTLDDLPADISEPPLHSKTARPVATGRRSVQPRVSGSDPVVISKSVSAAVERQLLQEALRTCQGNKAQAAKRLGLPRSTFFSKLKKHGISDQLSG